MLKLFIYLALVFMLFSFVIPILKIAFTIFLVIMAVALFCGGIALFITRYGD